MILTITVTLLSVLGYLKWRKVGKMNTQPTAADLVTTGPIYEEVENPADPSTEGNIAYRHVQVTSF